MGQCCTCFAERTHVDVNVPEADGAVGDEAGVEGVKVGDVLDVRDEGGDAEHEDGQDGADDRGVETLVVVQELLAQVRVVGDL